jgi:ATP-binding cassette subfamily B protein
MKEAPNPNMFVLLKTYWKPVALLTIATMLANVCYLIVPKYISFGIDAYTLGEAIGRSFYVQLLLVSFGMFAMTYFQGIFQTYLAEKAAYDIRNKLADKVSRMSYRQIETETSAKLLTNFTSDIEAIKNFLAFALSITIASVVVIIGAAILLLVINWKLALAVLALLPLIGVLFAVVFGKLGPLFKKSQEIIDGFNTIISESVVGAAIVRVFNSGETEYKKFRAVNDESKETSIKILKYFSFMFPFVGIIANLASLIILVLGGKFVIGGAMSLGDFTAFNSYVFILIFPIIMIGFVSSMISQAQASYARIHQVFALEEEKDDGIDGTRLRGDVEVQNVTLQYGEKKILKDVSFRLDAGTRTAIIGPTAAGKTQLLQILLGLTQPTSGLVMFDGKPISEYSREGIHSQVAFVFQDSVLFNMSILENVAFSQDADKASIEKAIQTAELGDFVHSLPKGLDSLVSERGTSLSGGQKQRVMLARALALNPRVLFLDDFTARVDAATEAKILANVERDYPGITLVSVTQKIQSIEQYDKIILLMEGEKIAEGTHGELAHSSPEYAQIMESQKSTQTYE